jgi:hypothetical protein
MPAFPAPRNLSQSPATPPRLTRRYRPQSPATSAPNSFRSRYPRNPHPRGTGQARDALLPGLPPLLFHAEPVSGASQGSRGPQATQIVTFPKVS